MWHVEVQQMGPDGFIRWARDHHSFILRAEASARLGMLLRWGYCGGRVVKGA